MWNVELKPFVARGLIVLGLVVLMMLSWGSAMAQTRLRLATTTSTDNSGLLAYLLPLFEQRFEIKVDSIAQTVVPIAVSQGPKPPPPTPRET